MASVMFWGSLARMIMVQSYADRGVVLQRVEPCGGKTRALNRVIPRTHGDILVLSDANTMYWPDAIQKLVRHFADPSVGAVLSAGLVGTSPVLWRCGWLCFECVGMSQAPLGQYCVLLLSGEWGGSGRVLQRSLWHAGGDVATHAAFIDKPTGLGVTPNRLAV
jgi:cellulose synthase/poly-beta-1,6-N-acetylglucosamine synthase-like glycosyltransferase